jgi:translation initiation factor IF-3
MDTQKAVDQAQQKGLDLVLVAPNAKPPVAKIVDFAKFKYQQKQKHKSGKKKTKNVDIKEIRFTPFIAEGDFNFRIKKAREFLEDGNKVKLNVKFVGRQITRKQFGQDLLNKAIEQLSDLATIEREPNFQGKILSTQLQPK